MSSDVCPLTRSIGWIIACVAPLLAEEEQSNAIRLRRDNAAFHLAHERAKVERTHGSDERVLLHESHAQEVADGLDAQLAHVQRGTDQRIVVDVGRERITRPVQMLELSESGRQTL